MRRYSTEPTYSNITINQGEYTYFTKDLHSIALHFTLHFLRLHWRPKRIQTTLGYHKWCEFRASGNFKFDAQISVFRNSLQNWSVASGRNSRFVSSSRLLNSLWGRIEPPPQTQCVESSWNVMAHGYARERKWMGNWRMEWVASTLHTTSEHGVSSITTADAHTSAASSRLNWCPPTI